MRPKRIRVSLLLLWLPLGLIACKTQEEAYYLPAREDLDALPERNRPEAPNPRRETDAERVPDPGAPRPMTFLVVHDAEGRPVYVELRRGSGNPQLDRLAQHYIISQYRFAPGRTDTVTLTLDPEDIPRP